ncbi:AraC family transcriptional regulator [Paenibacillus albidus]|uniref:AraC family transcriptional regulator n=1 Tax=Paenibacillus albidus TaxID=2041023 RepID=A0A917C3S6_9BACL|nr:AraC family transcriptional regulator [Paenibacillus albidus]GGF68600.1 AraC family transcriptional regulator [Paenibacillus albidus]
MNYPKELKEYPLPEQTIYPFRLFFNDFPEAKAEQNIMYMHWHEHLEIIVMKKGHAIFHVDSQPYEVAAGEILFVPSGGLHVAYALQNEAVSFVSIVFHSSMYKDWNQDPQHKQFVAPYLENQYQFPVMPFKEVPACASSLALMDLIIEEFQESRPAYQLVIKNQLHLLLLLLSRTFRPQQTSGRTHERHSMNRERFKPLLEYLELHYDDKITVEQAAKSVSLNPYHFCKTFKKLTGRTFIDYVNVCRVAEAEKLLLNTDLTVTEIAGRVGCDNPNYFTKLFKQYKGLTPSALRK